MHESDIRLFCLTNVVCIHINREQYRGKKKMLISNCMCFFVFICMLIGIFPCVIRMCFNCIYFTKIFVYTFSVSIWFQSYGINSWKWCECTGTRTHTSHTTTPTTTDFSFTLIFIFLQNIEHKFPLNLFDLTFSIYR